MPRALECPQGNSERHGSLKGWAVLFVELVEAALLRGGRRLLMVLNGAMKDLFPLGPSLYHLFSEPWPP